MVANIHDYNLLVRSCPTISMHQPQVYGKSNIHLLHFEIWPLHVNAGTWGLWYKISSLLSAINFFLFVSIFPLLRLCYNYRLIIICLSGTTAAYDPQESRRPPSQVLTYKCGVISMFYR